VIEALYEVFKVSRVREKMPSSVTVGSAVAGLLGRLALGHVVPGSSQS